MIIKSLNDYQYEARQYVAYDKNQALNYLLPALAEEVGELQGIFAKNFRKTGSYDVASVEQEDEIISELGDVLWNVAMIADTLYIGLNLVASENLEKLQQRKETSTIVQR